MQRIAAIADAAGLEVICHAGMNMPYGQHVNFVSPNSCWGEFFVGGAAGVPLKETNSYPVSDELGFGHGLSKDAIATMAL